MFVDVVAITGKDEGDLAEINWTLHSFQLDELTDYYKNPRSLSEKEFKQLKTSLDKFGMIDKPIVNADSAHTIIGGHQRKHVLEASGVKEIECWIPDRELSDKEVEELNIRLNKNTGSWDFDVLANEFELDDLLDWGFDKQELDLDLWADEPPEDVEPQIDKAEELREKWQVQTGQLWQLGEHRLICGDCTDKAVVERVMQGERAELLFTSPPYMDARDYGGNDLEVESITKFIPVFADTSELLAVNLGIIRKDNQIVRYWDAYIAEAELAGLKLLSWNIWDRQQPWSMAQNTAMFPIEHEWIFVFGKKRKQLNLTVENKTPGTRTGITNRQKDGTLERANPKEVRTHRPLGTIFRSPPHIGNDIGHPAMFPVVFPEAYIEGCTNLGDVVAEPFCGGGTTLIACERLGRKCRAVEISEGYVGVALQRYYDMTGVSPVLMERK